ncbi:MAG: hypothetical protein VZR06_06845 [Butyrivibrio sp.]|nr:hypothetical protein [Butyrivibrio sp.]
MPEEHQRYLEWNGDCFRSWSEGIGDNTAKVIDAILRLKRVEQQSYRACMGLLKMADKYSPSQLEEACKTALSYTQSPSYKSVSNILAASKGKADTSESKGENAATPKSNSNGITRGADYYRRKHS